MIVTHTVRQREELAYSTFLQEEIKHDEIFGELLRDRFTYYPTVTRGEFHTRGRITDRIREGLFRSDLGLSESDRPGSRWMVCGSIDFNKDMIDILEGWGMVEGTRNEPGQFVVERAFVG